MRKGTTPKLEFQLPFRTDKVVNAKIVFSFKNKIILEKYLCDCDVKSNVLSVVLTQEETFLFACNSTVKVQLRVLLHEGEALASDIFDLFISQCLDDEVINNE